jgi:fatty acid desaturase
VSTDPFHDTPLTTPVASAGGSGRRAATGSGSTEAPLPEAEYRARNESLGEMFASFSENLSTLVRQEIALAKAEATVEAKKVGTGAGMFAGAAVAGFLVLMFLSMALMWALGSVMHLGWAALIVAVVWAIAAAVLAVMGKKYFDRIKGLRQTQETVQEIPPTLNPNKETP